MTPADRCRTVAESCCQLMAPDQPWHVVVTSGEQAVLVEIFAGGDTLGQLLGRDGSHADAIRGLVQSAGRGMQVYCWVYRISW